MRTPLLIAAVALPTMLAAQNVQLVPVGNFKNEGHSGVVLPFNDQNMIMQQWMPAADLGLPNNASIIAIEFIKESNFGSGTAPLVVPPATIEKCEVRLGAGAAALGTDPALNFASGTVPALANGAFTNLAVPGYSSPQATGPGGNTAVVLRLSVPHVYDNTKPLLLDIRNLASTQTNVTTGNITDRSLQTGFGAIRGWGCPNNAAQTPNWGGFTGLFVPGLTTTGQITNASTTVSAWAWWLGFQFQTVLGQAPGVPLNSIIPGTGPLCRLWVEPQFVFSGTGTTFPQVISIPIPNNPALLGVPVGSQAVFLDTNAAGGLTLNPGLYAFVKNTNPYHGIRLALRTGNGDFSAAVTPQPALNTIPLQAYGVTIKIHYL